MASRSADRDLLAPHSIRALCAYLKRVAGISVDAEKLYFIESRIMPLVNRERLSGIPELVRIIETGQSPRLANEIIQALTVNETYFFRDKKPFDVFRDIMLPNLLTARAAEKRIRIWSAACSTGQEPYSLAMVVAEAASQLAGWRIDILATDIAEHVLAKARTGSYSQFEVQRGLPAAKLLRYFQQSGEAWQISDQVRSLVTFRQFNLLSNYASLGQFDVVFCRNVLIYFEAPHKVDVLARMARSLRPDGYLVLGASEGLIGLATDFVQDTDHRSFYKYRKPNAPALAESTVAEKAARDTAVEMDTVARQLALLRTLA